ncbi:MAG: NfeD family protein [Bacteroidales bacterium]|jgi:membrane-bound ClpP family serine protease|nr:NfeD family protein [Bacteroidales bacterium]MDD3100378.1 NfeD family protein [Bacteroidales bacterium]MDD3639257.1 NfeD family protein [Bacteroidales bacterium]MDD3943948.1 NfeD family protein [Bacteroidales bacterium]MDD4480617.1 NfeD family protein [Bacteroidales bacterium]
MGLIITLIVLGLLLLIAEMTVIPGFGIAGILGLGSFIGAIVMAFIQFGNSIGFIVLFSSLIVCGILVFFVLRSKTWRKITLKKSIDEKATKSPSEQGITVGMEGISLTRLSPTGNGRFGDITVEVRSAQELIPPKTPIKVAYIEGLSIFVVPL